MEVSPTLLMQIVRPALQSKEMERRGATDRVSDTEKRLKIKIEETQHLLSRSEGSQNGLTFPLGSFAINEGPLQHIGVHFQ